MPDVSSTDDTTSEAIGGSPKFARLGVCIVTFHAAAFIQDCLESLLAESLPGLKVVVVDNASADGTPEAVRNWAVGDAPQLRQDWPFSERRAIRPIDFAEVGPEGPAQGPLPQVTLYNSGRNHGFAAGSNLAMRALLADPEIDAIWNLNPDTLVEPGTAFAFANAVAANPDAALFGGRIVYHHDPELVQLDGGRLDPVLRSVRSVNALAQRTATPLPDCDEIDFVSGASMLASRKFIERAGLMEERFFIYFEEIDWQLRREGMAIKMVEGAAIRHHAGATAGSGSKPSPLSTYFTNRNLLRFMKRWYPARIPLAYAFAWVRAFRRWDGTWSQFSAFLRGLHQLPPSASLRGKMNEDTWAFVLGTEGR